MLRFITALLLAAASTLVAGESRTSGTVSTSETISASQTAVVEPTGVLTLQQALALALTRSPELATYAYDVRIAEAQVLQAGLRPNPEADLNATNEFAFPGGSERTIQLGQLIELAGKRRKRVVEARLGRQLAEFDYEARKREVFLATHRAFVEVLVGQRAAAVGQEIVSLTEEVLPDIERRIEAGKTSTVERTRSNVAVANARIALEQARRDLLAARQRLAAQWGSTSPRFSSVMGDLEDVPGIASFDALAARLPSNPRLARFGTELAQREATLALERARAVPDVRIIGGASQFGGTSNNPGLILGTSVPLPLFNRNQGAIRAAREQIGRTEQQRVAVQAALFAELSDAYQAVQAAHAQIELFRTNVLPQSEEALKVTREGYVAGRFSYLEFLDAQRTLIAARQQYLEALAVHQQAAARVESLTSGSLHRAHQPPNR
jgi:cobalt-zinc-cadmium efflux system outer membrane protein